MVTLKDIAEKFDLSESTVSRILNNKGRVSAEMRARVLQYAREVQYAPNLFAKGLKMKKSYSIGMVVPDVTNPYYAMMFKAVEEIARKSGYITILFNSNSETVRKTEHVQHLQSSQVDGLIVATTGSRIWSKVDAEVLDRVIFVNNIPDIDSDFDFVGCDNEHSAYSLTKTMIESGYRDIATITGPVKESTANERLAGYKKAMREFGVPLCEDRIIHTNFMYQDAYKKSARLFAEDQFPKAILAQNNVIAYAALRLAQERRLKVPQDLAITCFDHIDLYGFMKPNFTNMMQPVEEIGYLAGQRLLAKLEQEEFSTTPRFTILKARFISGETLVVPHD